MEKLGFKEFRESYYRKHKDKRRPLNAVIELTYKCNHKCLHCYNPSGDRRKELSKKEVFSVIDQLAGLGGIELALTGGEIFVRPDIMEIIACARKNALKVTLMTNGTLITEAIADELLALSVDRVEISFLGAGRKTFDGITRVRGSFDKAVAALKMLRGKGIVPTMKMCAMTENQREVDKVADLSKEFDVSFRCSSTIIKGADAASNAKCFQISPRELVSVDNRLARFKTEDSVRSKKNNKEKNLAAETPGFWEREILFNCMAGNSTTFINAYGEMFTCVGIPRPTFDVKKSGVAGSWEKIKTFVDNLKAPGAWKCPKCEYRNWCAWCPGRNYLDTGDIFGCSPYSLELAKVTAKKGKPSGARI